MILQNVLWTITLIADGLVALGFILIVSRASASSDEAGTRTFARRASVLQVWLFFILLGGFVVGTWATLSHLPIPRQSGPLDAKQVVDAVGRQWSWQIQPAIVETGSAVEFRVTSEDVNHDFAIYAPNGRIVTQTQAMPGYTNKLLYTFKETGTYTVQCLEYCGVGHGPMRTTFEVVGPGGIAAARAKWLALPPVVRGKQLVARLGCTACHSTSQQRIVGPGWGGLYDSTVHLDDGSTVTADPAYIRRSVRDPGAQIVQGYPRGTMPVFDEKQLSDEDLDAVLAYIESLQKQ